MTIGRQPITNKQLIERPYNFRAKLQGRKGVGYIVPFVGGNRSLEADLRAPLPCKLTFVSLSLDATESYQSEIDSVPYLRRDGRENLRSMDLRLH